MPDLIQSLQNLDIGHLRIVAGLWGLELHSADKDEALKELAAGLLEPDQVTEIVEALPAEAHTALEALTKADGRVPWAAFVRRFGEIRAGGAGRRDREQVYLAPISAAEVLFYRALLARAFFDTPSGAQEFAYIPDDLLPLLSQSDKLNSFDPEVLGRPASPRERESPRAVCDRLLDDATTLLAALRMGQPPANTVIPFQVVADFLKAAKIIVEGIPQIEPVRLFLEAPRGQALQQLTETWAASEIFNELRQMPGLDCEGEWTNQPLVTREFLLGLLDDLPEDLWWSLPALQAAIKEKFPDFQRPAGDYDSWFIKRRVDGVFLRGFDSWDAVDGELIRYLITGPLAWLGVVQLATPVESEVVTAFRVLSKSERPHSTETARLHVTSQGRISIPRLLARAVRYQIARFCEWEAEKEDQYRYLVTTGSLKKALDQGLKVGQLLSLLARNAATEIPPAFVKALKRWELKGTEARVETQVILRVGSPETLEELRKTRAGRFLGESLGPAAVVIKAGAQSKVLAALAEMGLLADDATRSDIIAIETQPG